MKFVLLSFDYLNALHNTLFVSAPVSNRKFNFRLNRSAILWIIHFFFIWKRRGVFNSEFYGSGLRQGRIRHE